MKGVELLQLDQEIIERVVQVAVQDAAPTEVMPSQSDSWTWGTQNAYGEFLSQRLAGFDGPHQELTWVILYRGDVTGVLRLERKPDGSHEFGAWLGRSWRSRGIGRAVLGMLRDMAPDLGVRRLTAETTADNRAALALLRDHEAIVLPREEPRTRPS